MKLFQVNGEKREKKNCSALNQFCLTKRGMT